MSGHCSWICGHKSIRNCTGVMGETPMRMTRSPSSAAFLARTTDSLQYWITYLASIYKDFPASVSVSPRGLRTNSLISRLVSSEVICLITAGGVMNNSSAALLKLPASAARINVSSWRLYMCRRLSCNLHLVICLYFH